jgi:hypothetical protein
MRPSMKALLLPAVLAALIAGRLEADDPYIRKVAKIYSDLNALIGRTIADDRIKEMYALVDARQKAGLVETRVQDKDEPILRGAAFGWDSPGKCYVILQKKAVDYYDAQPSIVLSMVFHEIAHAYFFFTDPYSIENADDLVERHMYQMDAIRVEANFISDYLVPNGFALTKYENLLLSGYRNGNMNTVSILFDMVDDQYLYKYYDYLADCNGGKIEVEAFIREFGRDSDGLLGTPHDAFKSDWNRYVYLVSLNTLQQYFPKLFAKLRQEILAKVPEGDIDAMNQKLRDIREVLFDEANLDFMKTYQRETSSLFDL